MKRSLRALLLVTAVAVPSTPALAAATPPTVSTGPATVVRQTTATLNGFVDDHGHRARYYFELGRTKRYGKRTDAHQIGSNHSLAPVAAGASGLTPDTTYHYRIVARSGGAVARGKDRTFHTPPIPTSSTLAGSPRVIQLGSTLSLFGALVGPPASKNANKTVALQADPWPFNTGFRQVGNAELTDGAGRYLFTLDPHAYPILYNTRFRVVDVSQPSVVSPTVLIEVVPHVTLRAHRVHRLRHGARVRLSGKLTPNEAGQPILLQRRVRGRWRTVARLVARPAGVDSVFARSVRVRRRTRFRVVTQIANGSVHRNVVSRAVLVG